MKRFILILLSILVLLTIWITVDLNYPYKTDIKKFDYKEVARLDGDMWRSYYEKKNSGFFCNLLS